MLLIKEGRLDFGMKGVKDENLIKLKFIPHLKPNDEYSEITLKREKKHVKTLASNRIAYVVVTAFDKIGDNMFRIMSLYPEIDPAKFRLEAQPCVKMAFAKYKIKRGETFFSFRLAKRTQI